MRQTRVRKAWIDQAVSRLDPKLYHSTIAHEKPRFVVKLNPHDVILGKRGPVTENTGNFSFGS